MSRAARGGLLLVAVLILVIAFIVLRPNDDTQVAETPTATPTPTAASADTATATATAAPATDPGPLLTGTSVKAIRVKKGDTVRFRVRAPRDLEVHIHGYDIKKDVKADQTANVSFKATIDGIFEIEFEDTSTQIASLRVDP
jgi:FtsP/CotA-like multicopper oxidase with cupredoxin domain